MNTNHTIPRASGESLLQGAEQNGLMDNVFAIAYAEHYQQQYEE